MQQRLERVNAFIHARWRKYGVMSVSRVNANLFLIQFTSDEGCAQVLLDGSFTFDNHLFVLKKWHLKLNLDTVICTLPIWIQLLGLPWEF